MSAVTKARAIPAALSLLLLLPLSWSEGLAEPQPSAAGRANAAKAALSAHCARCHQHDRSEPPGPQGGLANVLDLDAIATVPAFIRPGLADASRLYTIMLGRHLPLDAFALPAAGAGPTPAEIEAVRDWIEGLDPTTGQCPERVPVTGAETGTLIKRWLDDVPRQERDDWRFLSLAHLYNACASERALELDRQAAETLLKEATGAQMTAAVETVGDRNVLLAFRLSALVWTVERWDQWAKACRRDGARLLPVDCAAHYAIAAGEGGSLPAAAPDRPAVRSPGAAPTIRLARLYRRDVDLKRAAAEAGLTIEGLLPSLERLRGDEARLAHRLRQGTLKRAEWDRLSEALALTRGSQGSATVPSAVGMPSAIEITLASDKLAYAKNDLFTLEVSVSAPCNLTLIHVDHQGDATVIFPNDFEPNNAIGPGGVIGVPAGNASYQLRLDHSGLERVVAICQRIARRPRGIGHDFEHQRFTSLGNWAEQIRETEAREAAWKARMEEMRKFRPRERRRTEQQQRQLEAAEGPQGPEIEARTAIQFRVE